MSIFYDSEKKQLYRLKIINKDTLNGENLLEIEDKLNIPILSNNTTNLDGNKTNFNVKIPPLGYYFGFRKKIYSGSNEYISEAEPNFNIINYLLVKVNNYGKMITNHGDNEYLAKVIINDNKKTFNNDNNLISNKFILNKPENIDQLNISLHDPYGNIIDLNNQDFSLTFDTGVINNSDLRNQYNQSFP